MKSLEIHAYSLEEAKLKAYKSGITVIQDITKSWKKSGSPILNQPLRIFAADELSKRKLFNFENVGIIITISPGIKNSKKNPLIVINHKRIGKCKLQKTIQLRLKSSDTIIGIAYSKAEAINLSKQLIKNYKEDIYAKTVYVSNDIDFDIKYSPSVKSKLGQYIVFYVEKSDVELLNNH